MKPTISRRTLLRRTVALTTGVVAAGTIGAGSERDASDLRAGSKDPVDVSPAIAPDHDAGTGEVLDRDRHHHWETV